MDGARVFARNGGGSRDLLSDGGGGGNPDTPPKKIKQTNKSRDCEISRKAKALNVKHPTKVDFFRSIKSAAGTPPPTKRLCWGVGTLSLKKSHVPAFGTSFAHKQLGLLDQLDEEIKCREIEGEKSTRKGCMRVAGTGSLCAFRKPDSKGCFCSRTFGVKESCWKKLGRGVMPEIME